VLKFKGSGVWFKFPIEPVPLQAIAGPAGTAPIVTVVPAEVIT
jgi:hypothetical protein